MRLKTCAALLAILLPALAGAQEVRLIRVMPVVAPVLQQAMPVVSPVLTGTSVLPSVLPSLRLAEPVAAPLALPSPAPQLRPVIRPRPVQAVVSVRSQVETAVQEISALAKVQAGPTVQNAALAKTFDNSGSASAGSAVSVDDPGVPNQDLRGADRAVIDAQRSFRKELRAISHGAPLKKGPANFLLRKARSLGVAIRIHPSDLQAENNHWERGPHIHIGSFHIPVEPGYVPELLPGFINPN
ncbi:MAG: hypothetical protein A2X36_06380 [Elusimicrobia bacterium GWA2_69_24]|nr:MAG: hypothetical protein A2X36_06380 [Elusimicrobia bacterium GWA2_69_24]